MKLYKQAGGKATKIKYWAVLAIGYTKEYVAYDKYSAQCFVTWYLPFIRISTTYYCRIF